MDSLQKKVTKFAIVASAIPLLALMLWLPSPAKMVATPAADDAAAIFKGKCATCHGADGSGNTTVGKSLKIRDLRSAEVQKQTNEQLLAIITKGKGKMPPYEKSLGVDKCRALVAFVRTLKG